MAGNSSDDLTALVEQCRSGDSAAWRDLVTRVSPMVFSICRSMKLSREESFDVFGQVLYLMLTHLHTLRAPERLLAWVSTTTRREVYALLRRSRAMEYLEDSSPQSLEDTQARPDEVHARVRRNEQLMKAMALLPKRDFDVLRTLFFDCHKPDYSEVARLLDMPAGSVGPTRARSLQRLKKLLKRSGFRF